MTEEPKPREWKIGGVRNETLARLIEGVLDSTDVIHVIEYSAYLAEKKARERAEQRLKDSENDWMRIQDAERDIDQLRAERQVLVDALKSVPKMIANKSVSFAAYRIIEAIIEEALRKVGE